MSDDPIPNKFPRINFGYNNVAAKATSIKELAKQQKDQDQQTQDHLTEYRKDRYKKSSIINRIIRLEKDLKRSIDLFDIYSRFTNSEIDWLNDENILRWLLGPIEVDSDSSGLELRKIDSDQSISEPELYTIIQLHSRPQVYFNQDRPKTRNMEVPCN
jgi:hypothetical protein